MEQKCLSCKKEHMGGKTGKIINSLQITVMIFKDEILRVFGTFHSIGQSKAPHAQC